MTLYEFMSRFKEVAGEFKAWNGDSYIRSTDDKAYCPIEKLASRRDPGDYLSDCIYRLGLNHSDSIVIIDAADFRDYYICQINRRPEETLRIKAAMLEAIREAHAPQA